MSKIAIIGDTHFSPRTPVSRKDDYPETLLNKLDSLAWLCMEKGVKDVIFLGDLINNNQMTMEYFIKLYKKFLGFAAANIKLHTIIGNHDIQHGNPEFLDKSPMTLLLDSGLFNNKDFIVDDCLIRMVNYYTPTSEIPLAQTNNFNDKNFHQILIGHYFYLNGFNDNDHTLMPEQCITLGYDKYFLGHDHTPYGPLKVNGYEVHRPGSFSRATSLTCQVNRDNIQICIYDTITNEVEYINIPKVLPSKDVYKETKLISKMNERETVDITLSEEIDELINELSFNFSSDIYTVLDSMELDKKVKEKVTSYLEEEGIYR